VIDEVGSPHLWSRNDLTLEIKFPGIVKAVTKLKLRSTILDGEIVVIDDKGIPRFQLLQKWQKQASAPLAYYVFDLLWAEGTDLTSERVLERRRRLNRESSRRFRESKWEAMWKGMARNFSPVAKEKGMEGIAAKRKDSFINPGGGPPIGSRSKHGSSKNSSSEDLAKVKTAGKISAPCY
jgi:bifunctional non-homologous end joining protein LigD